MSSPCFFGLQQSHNVGNQFVLALDCYQLIKLVSTYEEALLSICTLQGGDSFLLVLLNQLQTNSWYKFGLKAALGIGQEANDNILAEFTGSKDTVVHAYSGGQLAQMIKIIAVTSAQIGSKSMTLSDDTGQELGEENVFAAKQKLLGQQIQELVSTTNDGDDVPFDTGW